MVSSSLSANWASVSSSANRVSGGGGSRANWASASSAGVERELGIGRELDVGRAHGVGRELELDDEVDGDLLPARGRRRQPEPLVEPELDGGTLHQASSSWIAPLPKGLWALAAPWGEGAHLGEVVRGVVGAQDDDDRVRGGLKRPREGQEGQPEGEVPVPCFVYVACR